MLCLQAQSLMEEPEPGTREKSFQTVCGDKTASVMIRKRRRRAQSLLWPMRQVRLVEMDDSMKQIRGDVTKG